MVKTIVCLADVVAAADRVQPDLVRLAFADIAFAPVDERPTLHLLNDFGEADRRAAGLDESFLNR